jgi:hypothetical protein
MHLVVMVAKPLPARAGSSSSDRMGLPVGDTFRRMMTLVEAMIAGTESLVIVVAFLGVSMDWYGTQMKMVNKWNASGR